MQINSMAVGSLVYVVNYSPFRGLRGTIQAIDWIADEVKGLFCFYQVALEGRENSEPIWFEADEVSVVTPFSAASGEGL